MKNLALLFMAVLLFLGCSSVRQGNAVVSWPDEKAYEAAQAVADADVSPQVLYRIIDLVGSKPLKVALGTTTKGNGVISIPGVTIRVYDQHQDGIVFEGGGLSCEWRDDPASVFPSLMISGVAVHYDEKGLGVIGRNEVSALFRYSAVRGAYYAVSCSPEIDYWKIH